MTLLIAGLILFLGVHSVRIFADDWRTQKMAQLGEKKWKGLYTLVAIAGFALIVIGYDSARSSPIVLWEPPFWGRHLAILLNLFVLIFLTAAFIPRNSIKAKLGHPMILSVKVWALAHLLANGTLADLLLFGSFLVWAVLDFRSSSKRDRAAEIVREAGTTTNTVLTIALGSVLWLAFLYWLHAWLIGVAPLAL